MPADAQNETKKEATITVRIDGREKDIETYFEEWGESFGKKIERMFEDATIRIDMEDDSFEMDLGHICVDLSDLGTSISNTISEMVTNMTIELNDLDPADVAKSNLQLNGDDNLNNMIDEIERRHHSKVENIHNLKIKIREDYVKIELDATLENGKKVNKIKVYPHH